MSDARITRTSALVSIALPEFERRVARESPPLRIMLVSLWSA